ncbi:MAG: hypothetical protein RBR67_08830 [Desulfobacterium sp.]|jgi:hypothetical protein|nr:hypothetical protein [Desulfobacterium sp.]
MTKIIIFAHENSGKQGNLFLSVIKKRVKNVKIDICRTVETFEQRLTRSQADFDREIMVLFVDNETLFTHLYLKKEILQEKRLLFVLPEKTPENISMVHKFFPRYFTFIDNQYEDLCDVLDNMIAR